MHSTEHDDVGVGLDGLLRETEGIADVIRDVLDFGDLVIVRQNDRVELLFERVNLFAERFEALG